MPRRLTLEQELEELARVEAIPDDAAKHARLRDFLKTGHSLSVTKIARYVRRNEVRELADDLILTFDRLLVHGARTDSGCKAKDEIVRALTELDCRDVDVFLKGVRHVQMEPVFGGRVDTAANLRANCIMGLSNAGYPKIHLELADLLSDAHVMPRRAAVQTLGHLGDLASEVLLRYKLRQGDTETEVMADAFSSVLTVDATGYLELVAEFLDSNDRDLARCAALAIGESGTNEALDVLLHYWDSHPLPDQREILLLPLALHRSDRAIDFMLDVIRDGAPAAIAALEALNIYAGDPRREPLIHAAVKESGNPALAELYTSIFPPNT